MHFIVNCSAFLGIGLAIMLKKILGLPSPESVVDQQQRDSISKRSILMMHGIINACPVPMALNLGDKITFLNKKFTKTFGYTPRDVPDLKAWWEKACPDKAYREWVMTEWCQRLNRLSGKIPEFDPIELKIRCKNGDEKQVVAYADASPISTTGECLVVLYDVTSKIKALRAVDNAKRTLQSVIDNIPAGVFWKDENSIYLGCNAIFAREAGAPEVNDIVGKTDDQLYWSDKDASCKKGDSDVMMSGAQKTYHKEVIAQNGKTQHLKITKAPLRNADGKVSGIVGIYEDITEEKESTDALKTREEQYRTLINHAPCAIYRYKTGKRSTLKFVSDGISVITGYSQSAFMGGSKKLSDIIHPDDAKKALPEMLAKIEAHETYEVEYRISAASGETRWISDRGRATYTARGRPIFIDGIMLDITEKKAYDEKKRLSSAIVDTMGEAIIVVSKDGTILSVNGRYCDITGYSENDVIGRTVHEIKPPECTIDIASVSKGVINSGSKWAGESYCRKKCGELFPIWASVSPIGSDHEDGGADYVIIFSDVTSIKESKERLEYLASHDALTGLPNRLLFNDRLKHAIDRSSRSQSELAVIFIDLDNFKHINDTLGHGVGDDFLKIVSQRLLSCVRKEDTVARIGGDEFIIMMEHFSTSGDVAGIARKMLDAFKLPIEIDANTLDVTLSIGISMYPADGRDADTLIKHADIAMYRSKSTGKNTYNFYTPELTAQIFKRMHMLSSIKNAVASDEMTLFYQPKFSLRSKRISGFEALIRWNHKELGIVGPDSFIPIAEESGIIVQIEEWAIMSACIQMKKWVSSGLTDGLMAINISGAHFQKKDFFSRFRKIISDIDLNPKHIDIEITEGVLMREFDSVMSNLVQLKALGATISIDDFGSGYSSLSYIKKLPIERLKIDKQFIMGLPEDQNDMEITRAIVGLCGSLKLRVTAEGVETLDQLKYLYGIGCDDVQGYLLGVPSKPEDIEKKLLGKNIDDILGTEFDWS